MSLMNLFKYQDLFWQLTFRDIKARYKQSILGFAWAILVPLLNLLVLSIVFSYFVKIPTESIPYPIFLFVALVPWIFTANAISNATASVLANGSLITKIYLPREILPLSAVCARFVDFLLTSFVLILFLFIYRIDVEFTALFLPVILFFHLILILGISFVLSATNVFYRDIEHMLGVFLTIWMYLTPIIYPLDLVPDNLKIFINLNPMSGIIQSYREVILWGKFPDGWFIYSALFSLIIFIVGKAYFSKRSKYFADVI